MDVVDDYEKLEGKFARDEAVDVVVMEETKNGFPEDLKTYLMTLGAGLILFVFAVLAIMFFDYDSNYVFYLPILLFLLLAYFGIFRQIGGLYIPIRGRNAKILGFIYLIGVLVYVYLIFKIGIIKGGI